MLQELNQQSKNNANIYNTKQTTLGHYKCHYFMTSCSMGQYDIVFNMESWKGESMLNHWTSIFCWSNKATCQMHWWDNNPPNVCEMWWN